MHAPEKDRATTYPAQLYMIRLLSEFWLVSNHKLTHPWDANSYLIAGKEPTLIDCGSSAGYSALKRELASFGYQPQDIRRVIATHGHWDHLSAMALLRQQSDAELFMHQADREQVETGDWDLTAAFLYNRPFPPTRVDGELEDGQVLQINDFRFTVYHTPGHSPGSVCLWTEHNGVKLLVAGDTLWGGYHPRVRSNLDAWKRSLDRLLELEFDIMTIGHYAAPALIFDAKKNVSEACKQLGVYFDPWFKPFHETFLY